MSSILNNITLLLESNNKIPIPNISNNYYLISLPKINNNIVEIIIELELYEYGRSQLYLFEVDIFSKLNPIELIGTIPRSLQDQYWIGELTSKKLEMEVYSYLKRNLKNIPTNIPCSFRIANTLCSKFEKNKAYSLNSLTSSRFI